jgi:hypothetical protein
MELANVIETRQKMDIFESEIAKMPQVELPLMHRFTDGMYIRTIFMPAGAVVTSRTHKTQHPFVITKGACEIVKEDGTREIFTAPHIGITEPGTRRVFLVLKDLELTTFHVTDQTDPDEIADTITESHNDLLPEGFNHLCFEKRGALK